MTKEMQTKLEMLIDLLKNNKEEEVRKIIKGFDETERKAFEEELSKLGKFYSINNHEYQGYNKLFLSIGSKPGMFGTFNQRREKGKKVKKGSKGIAIGVPVFMDKNKEEIRYMKIVYIFHEDNVEDLQIKKEEGI